MKKHLLWGAAAALALLFSSCDEDSAQMVTQMVESGLLGSAEITVTGQNGFNAENANIEFASTIMDEFDTVVDNIAYVGTLDLFANVDLSANGATLRYPFMGFQFSDSTTGTYTITEVLTPQRLRNFKFDSIADIVFNPSGFNVLLIAISDTSWYIAYDGTITVTEYPGSGNNMRGTLNNVHAYYFTESDVEGIQEHLNDPNFNLATYFTKTATINGEFKSKRYPALVTKIVNEAYRSRGLWEDQIPE